MPVSTRPTPTVPIPLTTAANAFVRTAVSTTPLFAIIAGARPKSRWQDRNQQEAP